MTSAIVDDLDAVLPQTQCRQCGFDGCRPYAEAIADGRADIDRCPPGGEAGVVRIAAVVGRQPIPLDPTCGATRPLALAVIDEALCIGCTLCIQACPVDAIIGAAKRMHDVIAELCTGCGLCLPPCPVDCIRMVDAGFEWDDQHANAARVRHRTRSARIERLARIASESSAAGPPPTSTDREAVRRQAIIDAAIARARSNARRRLSPGPAP